MDQGAGADSLVSQQVDSEGVVPERDVRCLAGAVDDGSHDLVAGGVAQRVDDAAMAVATFPCQRQFPLRF